MKEFKSSEDILNFAITAEQEAVDFYTQLGEKSTNAQMKEIFRAYAGEEMKHKARLLNIQQTQSFDIPVEKIKDLKIADYLVEVKPNPDMHYAEALILAMQKEKNAFRLYLKLSEKVNDLLLKNIFLGLAQEESKHKLRFELEYDEYILKEN